MAFRQLRKAPSLTLTATISLAFGIGANAGVFTVIERALLRPLPVSNPHQLVYVSDEQILTHPSPRFSYPFYTILRDNKVAPRDFGRPPVRAAAPAALWPLGRRSSCPRPARR